MSSQIFDLSFSNILHHPEEIPMAKMVEPAVASRLARLLGEHHSHFTMVYGCIWMLKRLFEVYSWVKQNQQT